MSSGYAEIDGAQVVACIENDCTPVREWKQRPIEVGRIVGAVRSSGHRHPSWLCEVIEDRGDCFLLDLRALLGEAEAAVWYGPPANAGASFDAPFAVGDTGPAGYEVYGALPNKHQGPVVVIDESCVVVPRLRAFIPPPYRRHYCWLSERVVHAAAR